MSDGVPPPAHVPPDPYLDRVTSIHNQRPKFMAWLAALVQTFSDQIALALTIPGLFDVDWAVGDQLDKTGEWIGLSRFVKTPLEGVYFEWDNPDDQLGWDHGVWWTRFDPLEGLTRLPDGIYRLVLYAKIGANHWDGTIPGAYEIYEKLFAGTGSTVVIQDNGDMSMYVAVIGLTPSPLFQAILTSGMLALRPEAVKLNYILPTVDTTPYFGFDIENDSVAGWETGAWGKFVADPSMP